MVALESVSPASASAIILKIQVFAKCKINYLIRCSIALVIALMDPEIVFAEIKCPN